MRSDRVCPDIELAVIVHIAAADRAAHEPQLLDQPGQIVVLDDSQREVRHRSCNKKLQLALFFYGCLVDQLRCNHIDSLFLFGGRDNDVAQTTCAVAVSLVDGPVVHGALRAARNGNARTEVLHQIQVVVCHGRLCHIAVAGGDCLDIDLLIVDGSCQHQRIIRTRKNTVKTSERTYQ